MLLVRDQLHRFGKITPRAEEDVLDRHCPRYYRIRLHAADRQQERQLDLVRHRFLGDRFRCHARYVYFRE